MAKSLAARSFIDRFAGVMDSVSARLNLVAELVVWLAVGATIAITFMQVIFRYGLDASLSWSEECARYLFVWTIFIGMSVATHRRQHIIVEVIVGLLPQWARQWADVVSTIFCLLFFGVFAYVGVLLALNAWQQYSTALELR